jgi:shikimate kinase
MSMPEPPVPRRPPRRMASWRRPAAPKRDGLPPRLFLAGFMGSGKTTLGQLLAEKLEWRFVDLDARIEEAVGMPIAQVFELYGESAFRRFEHDALAGVAAERPRTIVALGGGSFVGEVNRAVIRRSGISVWLDVPFPAIALRVAGDPARPLAASADQLYLLFRSRLPFYHEADVRLRAGDAPPDALAKELLRLLREDWLVLAERRKLFP